MLLIAGTSFAQEATPAPVAEAVQAAAADAAQEAVTEAAAEVAPVAVPEVSPVAVPEAPIAAAPMASGVVEGTIVNAPIASGHSMAPVYSNGCCNGVPVIGQSVVSAPMLAADPVVTVPSASACGCGAVPAPAPVSSCGCEAPAAAPVCCQPRQRRQIVRGAVSNLRSRRSSCCCN